LDLAAGTGKFSPRLPATGIIAELTENATFREIASVHGPLKVSLQCRAMEVQGNPAEPSFTRIHPTRTWPNFFSIGMIPNLTHLRFTMQKDP
jgi:hypothetical protein